MAEYDLEGVAPTVDATAFIAPDAAVIGDVHIAAGASIWFGCVLRGDTNVIRVGPRTNIQDGSILHVARGTLACLLGADITVGHGAVVHAATLHDRAFVGMRATVLDGAVIESTGMLAAGAVLAPGKRIAAGELWAGVPARFVRRLTVAEIARNDAGTAHYVDLAARYRSGCTRR